MKPAKASSPKGPTMTEEQAWAVPLEGEGVSVETLRRESTDALENGNGKDSRSPSFEEMAGMLGRPLGVGGLLQQMGPMGKAMEEVYGARGEHVVGNAVSRYGVCRLKVMRLGRPVEWQMYAEQVTARVGVHGLKVWAWVDDSNGQEMHVALLVWKQE